MNISVRKAQSDEYSRVRAFYWALIDEMAEAEYHPGWIKGVYPEDEYLKSSIDAGELYIGLSDGQIISAMIVNRSSNDGYRGVVWQVEAREGEAAVLHALGVAPRFAGCGVGLVMVQAAQKLMRDLDLKAIRLDVLAGNVPAEKLYKKAGFQFIERVSMFYEDTGWTDFELYEYVNKERRETKMEIRELNIEQIAEIREKIMPQDFPKDEIKPAAVLKKLYEAGIYRGYGYFEDDTLLAYTFFQVLDSFVMWDYLAVIGNRKNAGIGKKFMDAVRSTDLLSKQPVLLEVENPAFAASDEARALMQRRISYYLRNAIYDTGARAKFFGVHYVLMALTPDLGKERVLDMYRKYTDNYTACLSGIFPEHAAFLAASAEIPDSAIDELSNR